jgi:site-specific recombinase XerD
MAIVDGLSATPSEQLHFFQVCKTFLKFCVRRKHLTISPLEGMPLPSKHASRERVLSEPELTAVLRAAHSDA